MFYGTSKKLLNGVDLPTYNRGAHSVKPYSVGINKLDPHASPLVELLENRLLHKWMVNDEHFPGENCNFGVPACPFPENANLLIHPKIRTKYSTLFVDSSLNSNLFIYPPIKLIKHPWQLRTLTSKSLSLWCLRLCDLCSLAEWQRSHFGPRG